MSKTLEESLAHDIHQATRTLELLQWVRPHIPPVCNIDSLSLEDSSVYEPWLILVADSNDPISYMSAIARHSQLLDLYFDRATFATIKPDHRRPHNAEHAYQQHQAEYQRLYKTSCRSGAMLYSPTSGWSMLPGVLRRHVGNVEIRTKTGRSLKTCIVSSWIHLDDLALDIEVHVHYAVNGSRFHTSLASQLIFPPFPLTKVVDWHGGYTSCCGTITGDEE